MKHTLKKSLAMLLAFCMAMSLSVTAFAAETINGNTWYGDEIAVEVKAGENGYVFRSVYGGDSAPGHANYETSNHVLKDAGAVSLLPMVPADRDYTWTPDGLYEYGKSNYDVMYCCDQVTGYNDAAYYKRINLEDSNYYTAEEAAHIRAIVTSSYPYVSMDKMKEVLADDEFEYADELDRAEMIAAVQAAIWYFANGETYEYNFTANIAKQNWGGVMHDYTAEMDESIRNLGTWNRPVLPEVETRVNALIEYLKGLDPVYPTENQIVISNLEILDTIPIVEMEGYYQVYLQMELNRVATGTVAPSVFVNGDLVENVAFEQNDTVYTAVVEAQAGDTIKAVVSGTQILEKGVYFYEPEGGRDASQCLVGVAEGETEVHAEDEVIVVVDPATGVVTLQKVNKFGGTLSGVSFDLYAEINNDKVLVDSYEVDENGQLTIENLQPGTYELKETKAPYGFSVPEEPIKFEVTADGIVVIEESDYAKITDAEEAHEIIVELGTKELTEEQIAELGITAPAVEVSVSLTPGTESGNSAEVEIDTALVDGQIPADGETIYDYTEALIKAYREVTATTSEVETVVRYNDAETVAGIQPALKFDRNSTADQSAKKKSTELYTDNGHFHDPATFTVTDAPEGYPWKYVGHGDYSGHYISHVKVIYDRDAGGNPIKDADGNYVIKELQHAGSGTPLYYGGELVTNPEGPFHYATGTRPQQFLLMNAKGETMYGYCIDLETGAESSTWYAMANLEDNDYYASKEAENHVRNIIMNGYWGTAEGEQGSLSTLKEALKAAAAAGKVQTEQTVKMVNRKAFTTGYELQEGEYHYGNYVYWDIPAVDVTLTEEIIDQMTEGEALDAMQAAIWSWANGSNATLNGVDRAIVGDMYAASSQMSDSLNGKNDAEGAARTKALYQYLMSLDAPQEASVIINDKTFAKDMTLEVGEEIAEGIYAAALKFTVEGERNAKDNLKVVLTYKAADGEEKTLEVALTGAEAAVADENGFYTISGLELAAGVPFDYSLQIIGEQYLEKGAYIFTSEGGTNASQTMVTMAEGTKSVDVTKTMSITFNVKEGIKGEYTRHWSDAKTLIVENTPPYVEWNPGEASNISFMLIDKETGEVEFLYKEDIGSETAHEIPVEEGKVSVVFIKQSTSGMFWFSEEVDDELVEKAIDCLKDNNPSYKGHNAVAFGEGEHTLEFKKNKFATYEFHFGTLVIEDEDVPTTDEPAIEEPIVPDTETEGPSLVVGGNDNDENLFDSDEDEEEDKYPDDDDDDDAPSAPGMGTKTDRVVNREENRYEVEIQVPGKDGDKRHDEVILMVDGSYSMDNEWPAMKEAINTIGETVLNGSGSTQLTLMAFGMGDNEVLVHVKDADELAAALGELPGNLLYGRSSTNCEAGFDGVARYIENHDETLKDVHVIFISDGNINTDERLSEFYDWQNNGWHRFSVKDIVEGAFALECAYISDAGLNASNAYKTVFGDANAADMITWDSNGEPSFKAGAATLEQLIAWADQAWADAYDYSDLIPGVEYPVSVVERAFVKYDKEHNTHIQDAFYYALIGRSYPDRWTRTPAAADALAAMDEVKAMYVVDYDSYTSWMDTGITSEKSTFVQSNGIAGLCEALTGALTELSKTPFNDVVVTDYMSKWVDLDQNTLKIVDNSTGEVIWDVDGWKIDENRPTAQEVPVIVELVESAEYEAGGDDVIGNESGDIYKLTWYVKDGAMLRADTYSLKYEVTVDTEETGFVSNKEYPANGNTDLHYTDENGEEQTNEIEVPTVEAEKKLPDTFTVSFESGDASNISFMLIDEGGNVEFLEKIDIGGETSFEIPTEEGKISAVFVKQSTSGMFWFSEEVKESVIAATIECLANNNPSYKGYNALCYGAGDHDLEFKNNKFVTYTFTGGEEGGNLEYAETVEVVEETSKNNKNNKKNKKNK